MTETTTAVVAVAVLAVVTYVMRAGLILTLADRPLPVEVERALRYVAPAVLAALVVSLVADPAAPGLGVEAAEAAGLVVAGVVAWRWRNLLVALGAGMAVFWVALAVT